MTQSDDTKVAFTVMRVIFYAFLIDYIHSFGDAELGCSHSCNIDVPPALLTHPGKLECISASVHAIRVTLSKGLGYTITLTPLYIS